ncbi:2699_t:CDS:2 [Ambispora gerdemannii]|uniref:2699_t:CDS:1 n=1 Tax=Ambispora gerdemannii TaxID=144530 RepID=A0A9N8V327_9GLOM|nr:2699_t:CDS:2 [Ambispora gerdemannii]
MSTIIKGKKVEDNGKKNKEKTKNTTKGPKKILKRAPQRPATMPFDLYISRKKPNFIGQLERAKKLLLQERYPKIIIHALGPAIPRAIDLVMQLNETTHNQIEYKTTTSTVSLFDDIEPEDEEQDYEIQKRYNSAVHIQVSLKKGVLDERGSTATTMEL